MAGGSSSGSGVSVSAGFSPLAIGTETAGSVVWPASLNGLYGIKLAPGTVPVDGVFRLSDSYDGIGAFSRDPWTLAALVHLLAPPQPGAALLPPSTLDGPTSWEGLTIGVTEPQWGVGTETIKGKWDLDEVVKTYVDAVGKLNQRGLKVVYPLEAPDAGILEYEGENFLSVAYHEFPQKVAEFISAFEHQTDISNLEGIIKWNEDHAELALPAHEKHSKAAAELFRLAGEDGMGKIFDDYGLDIVISASDAVLVEFAACARWPICTVPLGNLPKNNQPFGWFAMAREGREDVLLRFMDGFYQVFPGAQRATAPFSQV
ncbi:hypothetical protein TruAng_004781 [Truncatella angustata]|nr:hypothetical protein TruAng_004781 [Truncatella angustata]